MESIFSDMIITNIRAVNCIHRSTGGYIKRRNREACAFAFKFSGRTVYRQHGKEFISDSTHAIFLPQGADYDYSCQEIGECIMVEFDTLVQPSPALQVFSVLPPKDLRAQLLQMEQMITFRKSGYQAFCMATVYQLIYELTSRKSQNYSLRKKESILLPALDYLENHYHDPELNNHQLAACTGMSEVYFRKLFTASFSVSPMKYVRMLRMQKAREMLKSDYGTIEDVALSVGYTNIYRFSKAFRENEGVSPSEYARSLD